MATPRTPTRAARRGIVASLFCAWIVAAGCESPPPDPNAPYDGERVELIVPFREGGGSDTYARAVAPYLQKYLEGDVTVQVLNVLGASGIQGGNQFALRRKPDGLSIFITSGSNVLPYLLGEPAVRYDFEDFAGIVGSPTGGVVYASPETGVHDLESLCTAPDLIYGGISPTGLDLVPLVAFELLELDVQMIMGYQGKGAARVAFEQGETTLDYQTSPAYMANVIPLVDEGIATPLFSFGQVDESGAVVRDPVFPDLPSAAEAFAACHGAPPSGPSWEAYRSVLIAGFGAQKNIWTHRGIPEIRLSALRRAADATIRDPDFLRTVEEVLGGYGFYTGEAVEQAFQRASRVSPEAKDWLLDLLRTKYEVRL